MVADRSYGRAVEGGRGPGGPGPGRHAGAAEARQGDRMVAPDRGRAVAADASDAGRRHLDRAHPGVRRVPHGAQAVLADQRRIPDAVARGHGRRAAAAELADLIVVPELGGPRGVLKPRTGLI